VARGQLPLPAACRLGHVEGLVGSGQDGVGAVVRPGQRHADGQRCHDRLAAQLDWAADRAHHPVGQGGGLGFGGHRVGNQDELVAAKPADDVPVPGRGREVAPDLGQQLVAGGVPEGVVDLLEVIDVAEQHRDPAAALLGVHQHLGQPVQHQRAIGQPGELVVRGGVGELGLHRPQQRDVLDLGQHQARAGPDAGHQRRAVDPAPHLAAVGPGEVHLILVAVVGGGVGDEFPGRMADQFGGAPAEQLFAGRVDPGDAVVLGHQRDGDR
jgi:hypothetical protein